MEEKHKQIILSNIPALVSAIDNFDGVLNCLQGKGVFSPMIEQEIRNCNTEDERKEKMLRSILKRGPEAFRKLYDCLWTVGNREAVSILRVGRSFGEVVDGPVFSRIQEIRVRPGDVRMDGDRNKAYTMGSNPKGYVLLFIFDNYIGKIFEKRKQGQNDVEKLKLLWEGLGYKVKIFKDLQKEVLFKTLDKFKRKGKLNDIDSCIIYIISSINRIRGYEDDERHLYTSDGVKVLGKTLIEALDPVHCLSLLGKPKLYFFQLHGCEMKSLNYLVHDDIHADRNHPNMTDFLITEYIFLDDPCMLQPETFLVQELGKVFSRNAHNTDVITMLEEVSRNLRHAYHETDGSPLFRFDKIGFDKKLFFNPGLYN